MQWLHRAPPQGDGPARSSANIASGDEALESSISLLRFSPDLPASGERWARASLRERQGVNRDRSARPEARSRPLISREKRLLFSLTHNPLHRVRLTHHVAARGSGSIFNLRRGATPVGD
jgi:hypothetical protein